MDIHLEVSLLSSYQAAPRTGHFQQLLHIIAFLKKKPELTLYFNPTDAIIDESMLTQGAREQLLDHYRLAKKKMSINMPKPRGRQVQVNAFVDASYTKEKVNR